MTEYTTLPWKRQRDLFPGQDEAEAHQTVRKRQSDKAVTGQKRTLWKRRGYPHARAHLPPFTGHEALLIVKTLECIVEAIWRTHGHAMVDVLACLHPDDALPTHPMPTPIKTRYPSTPNRSDRPIP